MDSCGISSGGDDESGAGVEDGGAAFESEVLSVNGDGHGTFPESLVVDVVECDEGGLVEFGCVETAECDLAVVLAVCDSRDLVGCDGISDETVLSEGFDGSQGVLTGECL